MFSCFLTQSNQATTHIRYSQQTLATYSLQSRLPWGMPMRSSGNFCFYQFWTSGSNVCCLLHYQTDNHSCPSILPVIENNTMHHLSHFPFLRVGSKFYSLLSPKKPVKMSKCQSMTNTKRDPISLIQTLIWYGLALLSFHRMRKAELDQCWKPYANLIILPLDPKCPWKMKVSNPQNLSYNP